MIRERFDRDGWVLVPRFLSPREVERLRLAAEELARKGADLTTDTEIDGARYQVQSAGGRRGEPAIAPGALRKIVFASSACAEVALLRNDRRVLKLMESVGVTSPRWIVDQINLKAARVGSGFPWHQDVAFVAWQQRDAIAAGRLQPAHDPNRQTGCRPGPFVLPSPRAVDLMLRPSVVCPVGAMC